MNSIKHRFTLDMHSAQSQVALPVKVGDTNRSLHISFTEGGTPYYIETGCLVKISIKRPTGTYLEDFCDVYDNAVAVYDFSQNENTCAVEGIHDCEVVLYGLDGEIIASASFTMVVSERVIRSDDIVLTDDDRSILDSMIVAEAGRVEAENARVEAENAREVAEAEREAETAAAVEAANQAAESVVNGKSAYEYAVDGGFEGTEEEFSTTLAYIGALPIAEEESV